MKSIEKVKQWLIKNRKDKFGNLDLSYLDFSDFNGDVLIYNMKVKKSLNQSCQNVGEDLHQYCQNVGESLWQEHQKVGKNLYQASQEVGKKLFQSFQTVVENLYQDFQRVGKI